MDRSGRALVYSSQEFSISDGNAPPGGRGIVTLPDRVFVPGEGLIEVVPSIVHSPEPGVSVTIDGLGFPAYLERRCERLGFEGKVRSQALAGDVHRLDGMLLDALRFDGEPNE
jgi:hypothetical protein